MRDDNSFSDFSRTVLATRLKQNKIEVQRPSLVTLSSDGKTATWQASVIPKVTGKEVLSVGIICNYIESNIDPNTCGEYCYRDATEVFNCLVDSIH